MRNHDQVISEQFGSTAAAYLTSAVHAQGADLQDLAAYAQQYAQPVILDMGCGGGHASFAVAPHAGQVTAYDLSAEMLDVVRQAAAERKLDNIETRQGSADSLPFADAMFDMVCTRFSAHHWRHLPQALAEAARVLKPGGRFIVIDTAAPADVLADTYMQAIELLRDPSHVRNVSLASWQWLIGQAGLHIASSKSWKLHLEFSSWVARMRTSPEHIAAIQSLWRGAPAEVRRYFNVADDYSFDIDSVLLEAVKR
ncbi:MAG TPA: class I SAM-dependent methyltransferase [Rugosibacter sp.]|nr:class I SAM-dependent methyltransferase [Rugosibacter sp.]HQN45519.1 class I SAM-dependent methyltransferase [Rugosibacter sp.]HQQ35978.1 class I SAM-dependent methyltransferase [Rugosibacter sp.]